MKKTVWLLLLLSVLLLGGCSLLPEEERAFAVCLGVDERGGIWTVYARLPTYAGVGEYLTVSARGTSFGEAMTMLDAASPIRIHYGQVRLAVFSKALAEGEHFAGTLSDLGRMREFRMAAAVAVTEDALEKVMDALEPETGMRLSKYLEVLLSSRAALGTIPDAKMGELLRSGVRQSMAVANLTLEAEGRTVPGLAEQPLAAKELAVQASGAWLIGQDGKVHGQLTAGEHQLLRLMQGKLRKGALSFDGRSVTVLESACSVERTGQEATCRIRLKCRDRQLTDEELEEAVRQGCGAVMQKLAAADCDALGLARTRMMACADWQQWQRAGWDRVYPALRWRIEAVIEHET